MPHERYHEAFFRGKNRKEHCSVVKWYALDLLKRAFRFSYQLLFDYSNFHQAPPTLRFYLILCLYHLFMSEKEKGNPRIKKKLNK